ncbi:MAG TPA: ATP-binding SpoIIE family protein phosphatase [Acetobacteraceae bacterium]|nr:ATP-binding SpoIIE family protein phosphatase [Acetobacteraceae bacterium]
MITAVADASQVAEARRLVSDFARRAGAMEARVPQVAIVVTELATNLIKHGGGGHILAARCDDEAGAGLEVLALDRGSGMTEVARCMQDGYSTAGSPGNGLGAVARLTDDLRVYSRPDRGCVIMARFFQPVGSRQKSAGELHAGDRHPGDRHAGGVGISSGVGLPACRAGRRTQLGAAVAPYPGEQVCGDQWAYNETALGRTLMVADGAGHGTEAARAANAAVRVFLENADAPCEDVVERMHRALMSTRGAAVAIARIDAAARTVHYVGVGNICGALVTDEGVRHMVSHNGTAGHVAPRIREFTYTFTSNPLVILHSDGLTNRWDLNAYAGLDSQHPSLIAGVLLRDHRRARDDATVVAMRPVP